MNDDIDYESLDDALDLIAAWLLAAYGTRLERVSLSLESYYGPLSECFGIVPVTLDRGVRSDGSPETRETLPSREVCGHAEGLFTRLYPMVRFTREVRSRRLPCRVIPHICRDRCFSASPDRVAAAVWTVGFRCVCSEATVAGTPAKPEWAPFYGAHSSTCWSERIDIRRIWAATNTSSRARVCSSRQREAGSSLGGKPCGCSFIPLNVGFRPPLEDAVH